MDLRKIEDELFRHNVIAGKDVYTVDSHHHALLPWSIIRSRLSSAPNLITLDHHTDSNPPFLGHIYFEYESQGEDFDRDASMRTRLLKEVNWHNEDSVRTAISRLRYDEQIHTATQTDIIHYAFVVQLSDYDGTRSIEMDRYEEDNPYTHLSQHKYPSRPTPPFTYLPPESKTFIIPCDFECSVDQCNRVIESDRLNNQLQIANDMAQFVGIQKLESAKYILDIDLDYFHTNKAIDPDDPGVFHRLIRNAEAITIAIEECCALNLQIEGENISVQALLEKIDEHIARAMISGN